MDAAELTRSAHLTHDESGNPVVVLPLPVWENLLRDIGISHPDTEAKTLTDLAPLSVGASPETLQLISRDEYYGDAK